MGYLDKLEAFCWRLRRWREHIPCWHGKIYRAHIMGEERAVCAYCHQIFMEDVPKGA